MNSKENVYEHDEMIIHRIWNIQDFIKILLKTGPKNILLTLNMYSLFVNDLHIIIYFSSINEVGLFVFVKYFDVTKL